MKYIVVIQILWENRVQNTNAFFQEFKLKLSLYQFLIVYTILTSSSKKSRPSSKTIISSSKKLKTKFKKNQDQVQKP